MAKSKPQYISYGESNMEDVFVFVAHYLSHSMPPFARRRPTFFLGTHIFFVARSLGTYLCCCVLEQ